MAKTGYRWHSSREEGARKYLEHINKYANQILKDIKSDYSLLLHK